MEGDISAVLFAEDGLPDVGVYAFVVIGPRIWHLFRWVRMVLCVVLEGELCGTCEHRLLQFFEDFAIEGVNLGKRGLLGCLVPIN